MNRKLVAHSIFNHGPRQFAVELWDGSVFPAADAAVSRDAVILRTPEVVDTLLPPISERKLGEAFVADAIDIRGDTIRVLEAAASWVGPRPDATLFLALLSTWPRRIYRRFPQTIAARLGGWQHSVSRDDKAVRHHYDISNEFYRLFLDPFMVYSCAYFPTGAETLERAQKAKLDLICRKLNLQRDEKLLDVGCGWGGLLVHAGSAYGAQGLGLTLSPEQQQEARARLRRFGDRFDVQRRDYRTLSETAFDKIASIGMMEHVGEANVDEYFATVFRVLRPGGLFLNQAIADSASDARTIPWASQRRGGFIQSYIFPDSALIPIGRVIQAAERAGFEVRDIENLREHYAETLALWLRNLEMRFDEAVALVGRARARAWRLYLASSAVAFRTGRISLYQLLLSKRLSSSGRSPGLPRSRADWYEIRPQVADQRLPALAESPSDAGTILRS